MALGYPKRALDGMFGATLRSYLEGSPLPAPFRARRALRTREQARPGDLVVRGDGDGRHVALVLEPGPDPILASHGGDGGPKRVPFSRQDAWHQQQGHTRVTWLSCLP